MKLSKVALQLYTLRDFCGSAKDLATSLKKSKRSGMMGLNLFAPISLPIKIYGSLLMITG